MKNLKTHKSFEGLTQFWSHHSVVTKTEMKFSTFIPAGVVKGCVIWLSGLTCTDENFITKAGAQAYLSKAGLMVICPDTSPRGLNLPGEHDAYDFGSGAGFYVDATTEGYRGHYKMFSYINEEIYSLIQKEFKQTQISIMGHSMGGHGALVIGLKNASKYAAISAFSPIVNPMQCDWGKKAFRGYLGENESSWRAYDACELLAQGLKHPQQILIHQGTQDEFLEKQLLTGHLEAEAKKAEQAVSVKYCEGYDHSYYFISTYIQEHIDHHARAIQK